MAILPKSLLYAIEQLGKLPGVGPRTAERYAYYLLRQPKNKSREIANALLSLHDGVAYCEKTFCLIEAGQTISPLYSDPARDKTTIAVVEDPLDVVALEATNSFKGTYHVLGGLLSPIDGITPESLHIHELIARINEDEVSEIILATNASVEGESTALYIQKQINESAQTDEAGVQVTRLARGIPVGLDLEYADQMTLSRALEGRQQL